MWDLTRSQEYLLLTRSPRLGGRVEGIGFAGEDEPLHVVRHTGHLRTLDITTGQEQNARMVNRIGRWLTPAMLAAFSRDGRPLAIVSRTDVRHVHLTEKDEERD